MRTFPAREELMRMPLNIVRGQDIRTKEEEDLVQDVVNLRLVSEPMDLEISRQDVPDIKTKAQEDHWQKIIDERTRKARGLPPESLVVQPVVEEPQVISLEIVEPPPELPVEPEAKRKPGRPPKKPSCSVCKMTDHLKDCPLNAASV